MLAFLLLCATAFAHPAHGPPDLVSPPTHEYRNAFVAPMLFVVPLSTVTLTVLEWPTFNVTLIVADRDAGFIPDEAVLKSDSLSFNFALTNTRPFYDFEDPWMPSPQVMRFEDSAPARLNC